MKSVAITHAEIIPFYGSTEITRDVTLDGDKGVIVNFNIKTRLNDRVSNSPWLFDKCSFFAKGAEQLSRIKEIVVAGNIVNIKGTQDRHGYKDKEGKTKYSDSVKVLEITPITTSGAPAPAPAPSVEDLPF